MGYDVYCAICGARAGQPYWREQDEDSYSYNLQLADAAWMDDVRVIGENPESSSTEKAFVSGPAMCEDYGFCSVDPGTDPNFFGPEYRAGLSPINGRVQVRLYTWEEDYPVIIPFHKACYDLLQKMLAPTQNQLDNDILYRTLKSLCQKTEHSFVVVPNGIDFGAVSAYQEQFWIVKKGTEAFVSLPTVIPNLSSYYQSLPRLGSRLRTSKPVKDMGDSASDVFGALPVELLLFIMSYLDIASINSFRASARSVSLVQLDNIFWKERLKSDMPWLYDLPTFKDPSVSENVDWAQIYIDLQQKSKMGSQQEVGGLVNRRRIWAICEQIAVPYIAREEEKQREARTVPPILKDVKSTVMPRLVTPDPEKTTISNLVLASSNSNLLHATPELSVFWNDDGNLAGFSVTNVSGLTANSIYSRIGSPKQFKSQDDVTIAADDWLTGIIFVSQSIPVEREGPGKKPPPLRKVIGLELIFAKQDNLQMGRTSGDRRLLHVSNNSVLVGFSAHWTSDGIVSKMALLQMPLSNKLKATKRFQSTKSQEHARSKLQKMLWRGTIPPLSIETSTFASGYWSTIQLDVMPMEALIFGANEEELSAITAIAADVQWNWFEVRYSDRASRSVGPRPWGIKSMSINGKGGERLIGFYVTTNHIPHGLRLVTNRGRQLIIGNPTPGRERAFLSEDGKRLVGLYGLWASRESPQTNLAAVGALIQRVTRFEAPNEPSVAQDSHEFYWEPSPPPANWVEEGAIFGQHENSRLQPGRTISVPDTGAYLTWLDCTKPMQRIVLTSVHPTKTGGLPLMGFIVTYVDGSQTAIGPSEFVVPPQDDMSETEQPWCWCNLGMVPKEELSKPHYTSEEWDVGSQKLSALRMWVEQSIRGIQFVCDDGSQSPQWGTCDGEPSGLISFNDRGSGKSAVGLKCYIEENARRTTRDDFIISCFQALEIRDA